MIHELLADIGVSISDLKKNPSAVISAASGMPVAILNRNKPAAYLVPAKEWEAILDALDDMELVRLVKERSGEEGFDVDINEL